jgi:hypothetical protein
LTPSVGHSAELDPKKNAFSGKAEIAGIMTGEVKNLMVSDALNSNTGEFTVTKNRHIQSYKIDEASLGTLVEICTTYCNLLAFVQRNLIEQWMKSRNAANS